MYEDQFSYHCGHCSLHWPSLDIYRRCPQCKIPTAMVAFPESVMTPEEAATRMSQILFAEYEIKAACESEDNTEMFLMVIAGAGFTREEKARIDALESFHNSLPH